MNNTARRLALPVAFLAVGLPAGIGAVIAMREDPDEAQKASDKAAFKSISTTASRPEERRAEARWERVTSVQGKDSASRSFEISRRAIQWRADWRCRSGNLALRVGRSSQQSKVATASSCPDAGRETALGHGDGTLEVSASGPWRVVVSQQVDTALVEAPLAAMTAATRIARGRFRPIQKKGEGTVSLHRLPSGRLALRYERFYSSPSPGLEVWLSEARDPRSTLASRRARHVNVGRIRSTLGSYNQVLPRSVRADRVRSVIIWCPTVQIAFAAAPLR